MRVLIVEEELGQARRLVAELDRAGMEPVWTRVHTGPDLMEALHPAPDVVISSDETPGLGPLEVLAVLLRRRIDAPLIVVSGRLDEESCLSALRMGAADYLLKDRLARLAPAVQIALANRRLAGEKQAAERREKRTASILRSVVANAPAAISVKAADGSYLLANDEFERLSGLAPGAVIGRLDADVFPVEQAREMTELDARCLQDSVVLEREEETGGSAHLCVRYPIRDDGGEVFGVGSIHLDITRQKQVENRLRAAQAEVLTRAGMIGAGIEQLRDLLPDHQQQPVIDLVDDLLLLSRVDAP